MTLRFFSLLFLSFLLLGCAKASILDNQANAAEPSKKEKSEFARVKIGDVVPNFTLPDLDGKKISLSDYKGKLVVLEWFNPGCPFVKKVHQPGGVFETRAAQEAKEGTVWLAINSGAPGNQGTGVETNKAAATKWNMQHPILLDESGEVGRMFGAKTTPHMFVISKEGKLIYRGGPNNAAYGRVPADGPKAYLDDALKAAKDGKPVVDADTKPWGCSVKYK